MQGARLLNMVKGKQQQTAQVRAISAIQSALPGRACHSNGDYQHSHPTFFLFRSMYVLCFAPEPFEYTHQKWEKAAIRSHIYIYDDAGEGVREFSGPRDCVIRHSGESGSRLF